MPLAHARAQAEVGDRQHRWIPLAAVDGREALQRIALGARGCGEVARSAEDPVMRMPAAAEHHRAPVPERGRRRIPAPLHHVVGCGPTPLTGAAAVGEDPRLLLAIGAGHCTAATRHEVPPVLQARVSVAEQVHPGKRHRDERETLLQIVFAARGSRLPAPLPAGKVGAALAPVPDHAAVIGVAVPGQQRHVYGVAADGAAPVFGRRPLAGVGQCSECGCCSIRRRDAAE